MAGIRFISNTSLGSSSFKKVHNMGDTRLLQLLNPTAIELQYSSGCVRNTWLGKARCGHANGCLPALFASRYVTVTVLCAQLLHWAAVCGCQTILHAAQVKLLVIDALHKDVCVRFHGFILGFHLFCGVQNCIVAFTLFLRKAIAVPCWGFFEFAKFGAQLGFTALLITNSSFLGRGWS